jgi:hypothetical protein
VLNEFYRVAFRKKVYRSIDELHNEQRPHQGRWSVKHWAQEMAEPAAIDQPQ